MTGLDLEPYRHKLLARERELNDSVHRASAEVPEQDELAIEDFGDRATSTYTKDSLLQQRGKDSLQLLAVQDALRRIDDGSFGTCVECGEPIQSKRLEAMPWAPLCIQCQSLQDEMQDDMQVEGGAPSRAAL